MVDLQKLGQRTLWIDCDVLQADGGTRTASITGACVATAIAFNRLIEKKILKQNPLTKKVAAVSVGVFKGETLLDLCYEEDKDAEVDSNIVMTDDGQFVEIQGSGEETTFTETQMNEMLALGKKGIAELCAMQDQIINGALTPATDQSLESLAQFFGKK